MLHIIAPWIIAPWRPPLAAAASATRATGLARAGGWIDLPKQLAVHALLLWSVSATTSAQPAAAGAARLIVLHELRAVVEPASGRIDVVDRITLPDSATKSEILFALNAAFHPTVEPTSATLTRIGSAPGALRYRLSLAAGSRVVTLRYGGRLEHSSGDAATLLDGHIGPEGVYLDAASQWYPIVEQARLRSVLTVDTPGEWHALSQGRRMALPAPPGRNRVEWRESHPQQQLHLVAGRFHVYAERNGATESLAYLRTADDALAQRYLEATAYYISLYSDLLGPYPYAKFALVENFLETGLGMPSFTLLGRRVIRLPFILHTAYPHEIVHNWWGNGVYVDYRRGNWSEGLTVYLADHLLREQRGEGARFRRDALAKYRSFVDAASDFPLEQFRGKHGDISEAIGYNKSFMFFHMLRRRLGGPAFTRGLRRFFEQHRFLQADYAALRRALEAVSGEDLHTFFRQWTTRTGAPALAVQSLRSVEQAEDHRVRGTLRQHQAGPAYELRVPVLLQTTGAWVRTELHMLKKDLDFELHSSERPLQLLIDPEFDVFRRPHPGEIPATLGELFGSTHSVAVLPGDADPAIRQAYRRLARQLGATEVVDDSRARIPQGKALWLLGWDNRYRDLVAEALREQDVSLSPTAVSFAGEPLQRSEQCVVLTARRTATGAPLAWLGCENPAAFPGLARKLPHYARYSYLGFAGDEPVNRLKGQWESLSSPLRLLLAPAQAVPSIALPRRPSLIEESAPATPARRGRVVTSPD